jgi:Sigma-70, region 4
MKASPHTPVTDASSCSLAAFPTLPTTRFAGWWTYAGCRKRDERGDFAPLLLENIASQTLGLPVERFPAEHREVLRREVEDLARKEIVEVTGMPSGTVMSRLSRARPASTGSSDIGLHFRRGSAAAVRCSIGGVMEENGNA